MCRSKTFILAWALGFAGLLIIGVIIAAAKQKSKDGYLCSTLSLHCIPCYETDDGPNITFVNSSYAELDFKPPPVGWLLNVCNITTNATEPVAACCCGSSIKNLNSWKCPAYGIVVASSDWIGFLSLVGGVGGMAVMLTVVLLKVWGCTEPTTSSDRMKRKQAMMEQLRVKKS